MSYETKVLLVAMHQILNKSKTLDEAKEALKEMANVEGIVLKDTERKDKKDDE